jgi:hypothetical protein
MTGDCDPVAVLEAKDCTAAINDVLASLPPRERAVLEYLFGFKDGRSHTLAETGFIFNVTGVRIGQIKQKALRKLRHPTRSRKLRDYLDDDAAHICTGEIGLLEAIGRKETRIEEDGDGQCEQKTETEEMTMPTAEATVDQLREAYLSGWKDGHREGEAEGRNATLKVLGDCYLRTDGRMAYQATPLVLAATCRCGPGLREHDIVDITPWQGKIVAAQSRCNVCGMKRWMTFN